MSTQVMETSVKTETVVEAPIERAFEVFTTGMPTWWPPEHHLLEAELAEMVFEPRVGGAIIDRGVDGSECRWARVLVYDPPHQHAGRARASQLRPSRRRLGGHAGCRRVTERLEPGRLRGGGPGCGLTARH